MAMRIWLEGRRQLAAKVLTAKCESAKSVDWQKFGQTVSQSRCRQHIIIISSGWRFRIPQSAF